MEKYEKIIVYAVVETNYEYNDEIHVEAGNNVPTIAYLDKEKAEAVALENNIDAFASSFGEFNLGEFTYDIDDVFQSTQSKQYLETKYGIKEENNWHIPKNLTPEEYKDILIHITVQPFRVEELELSGE